MLGPLLAAVLATSPQPRAHPRAEPAVYIPHLDRLSGLVAFLERAGGYSTLFRPSTWKKDFLLLPVDPTRTDSLVAAGLDPRGSATVSAVGDGIIACASVRD